MELKVLFRTLEKEFITDFSNIEVQENIIFIKEIPLNFFTKEELNKLANTCGVTISQYGTRNNNILIRIYIHKSFCSLDFMPTRDDKVKYLTEKIDKMSSELNKLINS